ncbi:hypothetical protein LXT21_43100 [Myxococcus sp. K38C18041901]|nr:hypothetical protein [Myxococcus guangdongensis]MCP3065575.1 hypothetical protein [Myxococcus guangdongensis]
MTGGTSCQVSMPHSGIRARHVGLPPGVTLEYNRAGGTLERKPPLT